MPVRNAVGAIEAAPEESRLAAWSGVISWTVYLLVGLLLIVLGTMAYSQWRSANRLEQARTAWDQVYSALKDKEAAQDKITALENVWDKVKGTPAHPGVMLQLAQLQWEESLRPERAPAVRQASLKKAQAVYDLLLKDHASSPLYGALAAEGAALVREQAGDLEGAIEQLKNSSDKFERHFLYPKLRYHLGRLYWLRAQAKEAQKQDATADRDAALENLTSAVRLSSERESQGIEWFQQAQFLKSLLDNPGVGLPDGVPPPPKAVAAPAAKDGAAETKPEARDSKAAATETKPVATEAKPATPEAQPAAVETKPAATETKPAAAESKPPAAEAKPAPPVPASDAKKTPEPSSK